MIYMKSCRNRLIIVLSLVLFSACENLFFPATGAPEKVPALRSTPKGVIDQLVRAYETKRIDLFVELLPKDSRYRFYVAPSFADINKYRLTLDNAVSRYRYVNGIAFYYWTYDDEIRKHKALFDNADQIQFITPPFVDTTSYFFTVDDKGDTTNVEMVVTGGELSVMDITSNIDYRGILERQIFYLERSTADKLWFIRTWFDLSSATTPPPS